MLNLDSTCFGYLDGQWQPAQSGRTFAVTNPFTGQIIAEVADYDANDAEAAVGSAQRALTSWRATSALKRAELLRQWFLLIEQHSEELAELMTLESGKPITEARAEVSYAASFVAWFSEEACRIRGDILPMLRTDQNLQVHKRAVGVCAAITPWNFPLAMITRKCAPALAAGCTFIVKPAEATPLSALALAALAEQAGIPNGVFNVLPASRGAEIGQVLTEHPDIKKFSFTGSTEVGKRLLRQCANSVKRVSMELGGNAPFIVFADANIELSVKAALASKFRNAGQTCVCANRFIVHQAVKDEFIQRLTSEVEQLVVGDGMNAETQIGPLINENAINKVDALIKDALAHGAKLICGGKRLAPDSRIYLPTLLDKATPQMKIAQQEIFGPVVSLISFASEAEAIEIANGTPSGLAAYVMTEDYRRIQRISSSLEFGMIGINEGVISNALAPFGGLKESGLGREGSHLGIDEYLETQYVCLGNLS